MATEQPQAVTKPIAPITGEMSPEQRKAQLDEIRRRMNMRTLQVEGPADWVPRWARRTDEQDMARLEYKGYRVVHEIPGQPKRYRTAITCREDGTYIVGDVILVEIPKEIWEFHQQNDQERAKMMVEGATQNFIDDTIREGVPTFERDSKGKITAKHK